MSVVKSRPTLSEKTLKPPPILDIYFHLFQKSAEQRSPGDKKIIRKFIESLSYFNKKMLDMLQRNSVLEKLLESLEFIKVPAETPVYHEGDPSDRFYILVRGELRLFQPRSQQETDMDVFTLKQLAKKQQIADEAKSPTANHHNFRSQTIAALSPGSKQQTLETVLTPSEKKSVEDAKTEGDSLSQPSSPAKKTTQIRRRGIVFSALSTFSGELTLNEILAQLEDNQYPDEAINRGISYRDQALLTKLHNLKKKYMKLGVCMFKPYKDVIEGEGFGAFTMKVSGRSETAVAISECYLLTLNQENFLHIFEEPLKDKIERIQLLKANIGDDIDDRHIKIFEELFKTKTYNLYDVIYNQGDYPDGIYLVRKGEIRLFYSQEKELESNEHKLSSHTNTKAEVARIPPNQFFGCENLLNFHQRSFTAEALTKCELMFLPKRFIVDPVFYIQKILNRISDGYKRVREWERARVHEIRQRSSEPKKVVHETVSRGQFYLKVLNKSGTREYYTLERIKTEPNQKIKEKHTPTPPPEKNDSERMRNVKSEATLPNKIESRKLRSTATTLTIPSSQVLSSNSPIPGDMPEIKENNLKIPEFNKHLESRKLSPSLTPKIDLSSQPNLDRPTVKSGLGSPKSAVIKNEPNSATSHAKKAHQRMLSDAMNKNIDPDVPISVWKYSTIEGLSKLKTGISRDKPRKSLAELVDLYNEGILYTKVDQQKNRETYSVRNSFSSSISNTPKSLPAHFFGKDFESMLKGSSAQTPVNHTASPLLNKNLGNMGVVHAPSSFSKAAEENKEKVKPIEPASEKRNPALDNIESQKIAENVKKNASLFGREGKNNVASFKSTFRQMSATTTRDFPPRSTLKTQEFVGLMNKKTPSYTVKQHTSGLRISSFSQLATAESTVPSPKIQLKDEVATILQGLSKSVNPKKKIVSNELVFTPGITTRITLRKSSLGDIKEKSPPPPQERKISMILQSTGHILTE